MRGNDIIALDEALTSSSSRLSSTSTPLAWLQLGQRLSWLLPWLGFDRISNRLDLLWLGWLDRQPPRLQRLQPMACFGWISEKALSRWTVVVASFGSLTTLSSTSAASSAGQLFFGWIGNCLSQEAALSNFLGRKGSTV